MSVVKNYYKSDIDMNNICFFCKEGVDSNTLVNCIRCDAYMHYKCEKEYSKDRKYCICPNPKCKRVGTLGCTKEVHIFHGVPKETFDEINNK